MNKRMEKDIEIIEYWLSLQSKNYPDIDKLCPVALFEISREKKNITGLKGKITRFSRRVCQHINFKIHGTTLPFVQPIKGKDPKECICECPCSRANDKNVVKAARETIKYFQM